MPSVLVVDDSIAVRNEVSSFLTKHDILVDTALDGYDALEKIAENEDIRLAIIDINMPNMDGLTLVEKINDQLNDRKLICIMLTTEFDETSKTRGKNAGVKGWIIKPFNGDKAINSIKRLLEDE